MAGSELASIGWVGTGVMGAAMCQHLLTAGHQVRVFTRTKARARPLLEQGAQWCTSPAEAAAGADFIVTMVGYPSDVREVVLGSSGVLSTARPGATLIDMTTSGPQLALEMFEAARQKGVGFLDAPVSGGDVGAREATLVVMVGGHQDVFDKALPVLRRLGKVVTLQGGSAASSRVLIRLPLWPSATDPAGPARKVGWAFCQTDDPLVE